MRFDGSASPVKDHDSVVAVLFATRVALLLLPVTIRSSVTPNAITYASLAGTGLATALMACGGGLGGIVAGLLVLAGFVLDCLDGTLARATGRTSDFGAYLDAMSDLVKVALLIAGTSAAAGGPASAALGGIAFLAFALCQHHVHVTKSFPQRTQTDYERGAVPWKAGLVVAGQRIDLAFAIGEVLFTLAVGAVLARPLETLAVLAAILPLQYASYAVRFWRYRYVR